MGIETGRHQDRLQKDPKLLACYDQAADLLKFVKTNPIDDELKLKVAVTLGEYICEAVLQRETELRDKIERLEKKQEVHANLGRLVIGMEEVNIEYQYTSITLSWMRNNLNYASAEFRRARMLSAPLGNNNLQIAISTVMNTCQLSPGP